MTDAREPLDIAPGIIEMDSLKRVLRLPSVCSKHFLTSKVDRCVTGLVAQQQTTFTDVTGDACAIEIGCWRSTHKFCLGKGHFSI
ncbi:hypothetical protein D8674_011049 [Pyrus ussuriensis x Pyrus communis]|uniref:Uncharacterized protein n=1 Tax=Pyrus ussuriensis x Pyrus communis TaxID=2448454 RepID=A0A5N5G260_9ROSA|nr:hypothetical protein D8674_011049 [Pyrus ussuriensis x Pyrus communis]